MNYRRCAVAALTTALVLLPAAPATAQAIEAADTYDNFAELDRHEQEGEDFEIHVRDRRTGLAVIAIHGGGIERGTSELTRAISGEDVPGEDVSEYRFEGIKPEGNAVLHITSTRFDEPLALDLVTHSDQVASIHGAGGAEKVTYVGGRDADARERMILALRAAGFRAENAPDDLAGTDPDNIVNRGESGEGVQLEITEGQRKALFGDFSSRTARWNTRNEQFDGYVTAARAALDLDARR